MSMNTSGEPSIPEGRLLSTESEAAKALSVSPRTLFSLRKSGKLAASKIGTRVLYHIDELRRFAAASVGKTVNV